MITPPPSAAHVPRDTADWRSNRDAALSRAREAANNGRQKGDDAQRDNAAAAAVVEVEARDWVDDVASAREAAASGKAEWRAGNGNGNGGEKVVNLVVGRDEDSGYDGDYDSTDSGSDGSVFGFDGADDGFDNHGVDGFGNDGVNYGAQNAGVGNNDYVFDGDDSGYDADDESGFGQHQHHAVIYAADWQADVSSAKSLASSYHSQYASHTTSEPAAHSTAAVAVPTHPAAPATPAAPNPHAVVTSNADPNQDRGDLFFKIAILAGAILLAAIIECTCDYECDV